MIVHGEPTGAATRRQDPVLSAGASGVPHEEHARLALNAEGSLDVTHLRWSSWGASTANADGVARWHGCSPRPRETVTGPNAPSDAEVRQVLQEAREREAAK
jgi:hypothetical protein